MSGGKVDGGAGAVELMAADEGAVGGIGVEGETVLGGSSLHTQENHSVEGLPHGDLRAVGLCTSDGAYSCCLMTSEDHILCQQSLLEGTEVQAEPSYLIAGTTTPVLA